MLHSCYTKIVECFVVFLAKQEGILGMKRLIRLAKKEVLGSEHFSTVMWSGTISDYIFILSPAEENSFENRRCFLAGIVRYIALCYL